MDMRDAIKQITGKEPSDTEIQKVMAIAHALDMPAHDPMIAILVMLDTYHGIYTDLPGNVSKSVSETAKNAATIAEADMVKAVSKLVPTVSDAVSKAAQNTMDRIQIGQSLWTMWASTITVGVIVTIGFLCGADVFTSYAHGHLSAWAFWKLTKWGIACGLGLPTMAIMSLWLFSIDYRNQVQTIFAYATAAIAAILFIAITLNLAQVFFLK